MTWTKFMNNLTFLWRRIQLLRSTTRNKRNSQLYCRVSAMDCPNQTTVNKKHIQHYILWERKELYFRRSILPMCKKTTTTAYLTTDYIWNLPKENKYLKSSRWKGSRRNELPNNVRAVENRWHETTNVPIQYVKGSVGRRVCYVVIVGRM